jgi:hypothetical protein
VKVPPISGAKAARPVLNANTVPDSAVMKGRSKRSKVLLDSPNLALPRRRVRKILPLLAERFILALLIKRLTDWSAIVAGASNSPMAAT